MFKAADGLQLGSDQQRSLHQLVRSGKTPQKIAARAQIVLLAGQGVPNYAIARQLHTSRPTVLLWRERFNQLGVAGLLRDNKRPGRNPALSAEKVKAVVEATLQSVPRDATHWSVRSMAKAQGISRMAVQRIWKAHRLQPHRVENFKLSRDPHFVEKLRDVVGLYLNPPDKALVLSVDEKSQIQALDRTAPLLPLRPGIAARHSHDYKRHGTTTLFAALSLLDGKVIGQCLPRHRSQEFIRFLDKIDRQTPAELDLHLIVDNYSAHKTSPVKRWLKRHPRFVLHFLPTSSSWLNLVERWFGEITRKRIRRGTFKSVHELVSSIETYLQEHNRNPKKFVWTKNAQTILAKINHCKEALGTAH
jgi:transposase